MTPPIHRLGEFLRGLSLRGVAPHETIGYLLERRAQAAPLHPFVRFEDRSVSYGDAARAIRRHANAYKTLGIKRGDTVALLFENRPELLFHLYGLHRLGAVASLINAHLKGDALAHALRVCEPSATMVGSELWDSYRNVEASLGAPPRLGVIVDREDGASAALDDGTRNMAELVANASSELPDEPLTTIDELAAYIYTSGTTGLPKAALIKHHRFHRAGAVWSSLALDLRRDDVMYCCLPLYHSNAVLLAASSVVHAGATLALARKFSRTRFWDDIREHQATAFIYIGELCRYLLSAPPSPRDREHRVRVVTGNGLRPDIWQSFEERFGLDRIVEFYASTEGNCITFNLFNLRGSVGPLVPGMALARWNEEAQDFVRDARGFIERARPGEPGILLGKIRPRFEFDGYRDAGATDKKVLRDVFRKGDAYFNTGDLLRADRLRHLYFTDRVGDTFRWKGENVSTTEVQEALAKWPALAEVNVYGVQVPKAEGRVGMAAVALKPGATFDARGFAAHVRRELPAYARPTFVRVSQQLEVTSTFKLKKQELQREGFDPARVTDPLYFLDDARAQYVPLDAALHAAIRDGSVRL